MLEIASASRERQEQTTTSSRGKGVVRRKLLRYGLSPPQKQANLRLNGFCPMPRRKRYTRNLGRTIPEPQPRRLTVEWGRFEHKSEPYGVFSYLSDARAVLSSSHSFGRVLELDRLIRWFERELDSPELGEDSTEKRAASPSWCASSVLTLSNDARSESRGR